MVRLAEKEINKNETQNKFSISSAVNREQSLTASLYT